MNNQERGVWIPCSLPQSLQWSSSGDSLSTQLDLIDKRLLELVQWCSLGDEAAEIIALEIKELTNALTRTQQTWLWQHQTPGDCHFSMYAGTGGSDSQLWVQQLWQAYERCVNRLGYTVEYVDEQHSADGIRKIEVIIRGRYAQAIFGSEAGLHRRIHRSPFDPTGRRHTSFARIDAVLYTEPSVISFSDQDLRIETYRAGGPGGQHRNSNDTAVRITHLPTRITASSSTRSQTANREQALRVLAWRVAEHHQATAHNLHRQELQHQRSTTSARRRSYVFHPRPRLTDHLLDLTVPHVQPTLDGDFDLFMLTLLRQRCPVDHTNQQRTKGDICA